MQSESSCEEHLFFAQALQEGKLRLSPLVMQDGYEQSKGTRYLLGCVKAEIWTEEGVSLPASGTCNYAVGAMPSSYVLFGKG